jgi:hypothetical protein
VAALNRAAHPANKAQLADWYHHTVLPRLLPARTDQLSSQAFWNHMKRVTPADIQAVEQALSQRLIRQLNLSLRTLVYDGTHFFAFINTRTPARLPARGHNKQHRGDLRQVSLGMLVSTDFHVPLFHLVYTGNQTDATAFQSVWEELARRYRQLAQGCEHILSGQFLKTLIDCEATGGKALTLTSLLQRTLHQHGLDLSLRRMMELLGGIQEVRLICPRQQGEKHPRTATCLSERDAEWSTSFFRKS